MKKLQELKKSKKGFTLVEIIVVLAILAILIAVALPNMNGILKENKAKVMYQDARVAFVAAQTVQIEGGDLDAAHIQPLAGIEGTPIIGITTDTDGKITDFYYMNDAKNGDSDPGTAVHITADDNSEIIAAFPAGVAKIDITAPAKS